MHWRAWGWNDEKGEVESTTCLWQKYLPMELGEGTVSLMRSIKDTIDPLGIMNPGKLCGWGLAGADRRPR